MSTYYVAGIPYSSSDIYHHGIKGQKWGVRRTPEQLGYDVGQKIQNGINRVMHPFQKAYEAGEATKARINQGKEKLKSADTKTKIKTAAKVGAALAIAGLAVYGAHKINSGNLNYLKGQNWDTYMNIENDYWKKAFDLDRDRMIRSDSARNKRELQNINKEYRLLDKLNDRMYKDNLRNINSIVKSHAKNTKFVDKVKNARKYYRGRVTD